jgi:hypothetical protein
MAGGDTQELRPRSERIQRPIGILGYVRRCIRAKYSGLLMVLQEDG